MFGVIFATALALIVVSIVLIAIVTRNNIVHNKNMLQRAWASVIAWQRKKNNVIPEIEKGMREYSEFEASTQNKLTSLRTSIGHLSEYAVDTKQLEAAQVLTKELIGGLKATFESYANLKTSELYLRWMKELSEVEDNIVAAIEVFNGAVQGFNDSIQEFPGNVINDKFNHEKPITPFHDSQAETGFEYKLNAAS